MGKATLVVMAAGIGSRFGGGIKQLEPVGPNGELIIDYSVYDAVQAGFDKVVFVIRRDLEQDFKDVIGSRIKQHVDVHYVYQEIEDIPIEFQEKAVNRKKPWGTGQAVLCCREVVKEPFLVINADDYYGKEAYIKAYDELTAPRERCLVMHISMVGFILENTLSENGTVTRGLCRVDGDMLMEVVETYEICRSGDMAEAFRAGERIKIPLDCPVSMNMWGLYPEFFDILEKGFKEFLTEWHEGSPVNEYLLPVIIGRLLASSHLKVKVLPSLDQWFGVTYKEDKDLVAKSLQKLVSEGLYPDKLY